MERVNPILNARTDTKPSRYSRGPWRLVECQETGMVFLENPPDYSELMSDFEWDKSYQEEKERRRREEPVLSIANSGIRRVRVFLKSKRMRKIERLSIRLLNEVSKGSEGPLQLLDVGCGEGQKTYNIALYMREQHGVAATPIGVEISGDLKRKAEGLFGELGGQVVHAPAIEGVEKLKGATFHLITLCSFLEHEINPLPLLTVCGEKLSEDGLIIIKVPNYGCINRKVRQRRWCGFRYPDHVNYFTPATLRLLVERSGLRILKMNFFDRFPTNDNMWAVVGR